ncbi:cellulose biosynthesis protein BcsS [Bosea sp. (in: a-proteobacteria)]|uniref:cellulose biosynthesis protein BcsS n=1 Tax=Bosea sp. (in: a-proteobacteria) TaxID=1871050 RepID=UPI002638C550|nr:cellulose biosynthesis protein BcsS [Bosea sp. (in: a-proteobacteria)]MCO5092242.1 cellulose biosynthesis protein BcsS [Bosea sp. (in: a-proteobacteria)]
MGRSGLAGLAMAFAAAPICAAGATEDETERAALSTVIFGSMEAGPTKTLLTVGVKRAIGGGGLAASGPRLFVKAGGTQEQTHRRRPHGVTYKSESQALLGYEWRIGDSFLALYAGSDVESEQPVEAFGPSRTTTRYGARLQADLWLVPAPGIVVQANAYVSSLNGRVWGRLAPGWRVPAGFHLGPEFEAYGEHGYRKYRLGLHLTGLRALGLEWRLAGGVETTSDRPAAFYGTLGLHWQR